MWHQVHSVTVMDAPVTQGGNFLEVGLIWCNYADLWSVPCAEPVLFVCHNCDVTTAQYFPTLRADEVALFMFQDGRWAALARAGGTWHLLGVYSLSFTTAPTAREAREIYIEGGEQ